MDNCIAGTTTHEVLYAGDNRGFDPFSQSYRTSSEVVVSSIAGTAVYSSFLAGKTTRYASDALAPDGYTLRSDSVLHDCHYTDNVVWESNSDMHASVTGGGGTVHANLYGSGTNLAATLKAATPSITWNVTFTIDTSSNPAYPAYTIDYTHDCYPAHEAYIGTQRVYGFLPSSNAWYNIGFCLGGGGQIVGSTVGTVN